MGFTIPSHEFIYCLLTHIHFLFCLDKIPYFEFGDSVTYNNEKEGIIECLKKDAGVVDLDSGVSTLPEWISTKAILTTWLADALAYELWVGRESSSAYAIYYSDLPWPLGKILSWKKAHCVKLKHGITNDNAEVKKEEVSLFFFPRATIFIKFHIWESTCFWSLYFRPNMVKVPILWYQ